MVVFTSFFDFDEIPARGIRGIDKRDVRFAKKFGYQIKLLAFAKLEKSLVEVSVEPTLIPVELLMANVDGPMNAVSVEGNFVGHTLYYGQGAGSHPTASAVVADIIEACGTINTLSGMEQVKTNPEISDHPDYELMKKEDVVSGHYMRLEVSDKPGVLSEITGILASQNVSVDRFFQEKSEDSNAEIILLTHMCSYGKIVEVVDMLINLENVKGKPVVFRVEEKA
ncbi:MAG: ACT domain-containing protein [Burkholderiaceae bacterium]